MKQHRGVAVWLAALIGGLSSITGLRVHAQIVTTVGDVADGFFDPGSSNVYADGDYLIMGGKKPGIDGITFDMTDLADETLTTFSVTAVSQYQLTLGQSVSVPYGYYIGGFTDETSGAQLATETYVPVGTLTATVVPVSNGSLTGLLFTGGTDWLKLAQSWADDPSTNYGFVFPSTTFASLVPANGGDLYTRETGDTAPFGTITSVPDIVPEPAASMAALELSALALAIRRNRLRRTKHR
jgi:hypothetical protein